jgi:NAD(P)-dependent dehydrogenase (short-subunit alcohol dehydrogenase family)
MSKVREVALLVGAGDAIGAAVARRFAEGGYAVCIARRDGEKSKALAEELAADGQEIHTFSVDARKEEEVQQLFATVERDVGPVSVCLFNAGSNVSKPVTETTGNLFFKAWELACYAGFLVGREAARVHDGAWRRHLFCSPARLRAFAEAPVLRRSLPRSSAFGPSRSPWRANWAPGISTSSIC